MADDRATALRALAASDPGAARDEVHAFVSDSPRIRASGRAVVISDAGSPGSKASGASPLAGAASVTASYAREIASNSGVYGSYKFDAFDTHRDDTQRYGVDLGANFFVLAQSKKLAVSVARIASVKGRSDALCSPYIWYVNKQGKCIRSGDVPGSSWSCMRGPRDAPPAESTRFPRQEEVDVMASLSSQLASVSVVGTSEKSGDDRAPTPPARGGK